MTTAVRETPILFRGPMVKAILDGRKTQTRRVVGPGNSAFGSAGRQFFEHADFEAESCTIDGRPETNQYLHVPCHAQSADEYWKVSRRVDCEFCRDFGWEDTRHRLYPYWTAGDRLWVREAWSYYEDKELYDCIRYQADGSVRKPEFNKFPNVSNNEWFKFEMMCDGIGTADHKWRPSIHMPRWASRIRLEITGVRVERVQDISEEDAIAEGSQIPIAELPASCRGGCLTERTAFSRIWDSINGKGSWDANHWVWAISFRRLP